MSIDTSRTTRHEQLTNKDFRSIGAQIADAVYKDSGKVISWTGRIAPAAAGMDWMEFSILGKPQETMIARLGDTGLTFRNAD